MAKRTAKSLASTRIDVVDLITEKLNEIDGIEFVRDAWVNKAPEQYGVVTLNAEPLAQYADDHLIDEMYQANVDVFADGSGDEWPELIRGKLTEMEAANDWLDISCQIAGRELMFDLGKVHWTFRVLFDGPLIRTIGG